MLAFFRSLGNDSDLRSFLKVRCSGFDIEEAQSFIICIENSSWPWVLFWINDLIHHHRIQTIALKENCPPDKCPQENYSLDDCTHRKFAPWINTPWIISLRIIGPRTIASKIIESRMFPPVQLLPRKIFFWMISCLHNWPSDNWPRGKLPPRKVVARMNYNRDIFPRRFKNRSTLVDSCFFLFFFLGV